MRQKSVLACLLVLLVAGAAGATVLVKMEFSDLAEQARLVVLGTVVQTQGAWDAERRFIHTDVTIAVDRYIVGAGEDEITLRTPGGMVGDEGQLAHGAASFETGERVLVFLTHWEDGTPKVLGYVQGKSRLIRGDDGRELLQGGVAHGRTLGAAIDEIRHGVDHNIPLRPSR